MDAIASPEYKAEEFSNEDVKSIRNKFFDQVD